MGVIVLTEEAEESERQSDLKKSKGDSDTFLSFVGVGVGVSLLVESLGVKVRVI